MKYGEEEIVKITKTLSDELDTPLVIPTNKLDADQYYADDLDGVTESVFGSGNLAFGIMQASLADEAMNNDMGNFNGDTIYNSDISIDNGNFSSGLSDESISLGANSSSALADLSTDTDRIETGLNDTGSVSGENSDGNFASSTVGSLGVSQLSSDAGNFAPSGSGLSLNDGLNGFNGDNGSDGMDGKSPDTPDYPDEKDCKDTGDGCKDININIGDTIINLGDVNIDIINTLEILDGLIIDLGDTIEVLNSSISNVINILGDVLVNIENIDLSSVSYLVENVTNNLNQTLHFTLNEIFNTTENITDILNNIKEGLDLEGLDINLDLNVLDSIYTSLNIPLSNVLASDLNADIDLRNIYDSAETIVGLTGIDLLSDVLGKLGAKVDVLQSAIDQATDIISNVDLTNPGDTVENLQEALAGLQGTTEIIVENIDTSIGGILDTLGGDNEDDGQEGFVSQTLDPVINDIGNVIDDITQGATTELTENLDNGVDKITDVTDDLTAAITDPILGANNNNQDGTDSDVTIDLGLNIVDTEIINEEIEIALDPVEDLIGDIDLDISPDLDLFGNTDEIDNNSGDEDITIDTNIDLVDDAIAELDAEIPLDPLEELTGDVDIDTGAATDLLSNLAAPVVNNEEGGTGEDTLLADLGDVLEDTVENLLGSDDDEITDAINLLNNIETDECGSNGVEDGIASWTENTIGQEGLFDDVIGGIGGEIDVLPDVSGTVSEGLGVLDVEPEIDVASLGGLFG